MISPFQNKKKIYLGVIYNKNFHFLQEKHKGGMKIKNGKYNGLSRVYCK